MVASLDFSDFPINLLNYGLTILDEEQEKPIIHSEASPLTCQAVKKEKKVFAGSLILAKDTICYLGELTKYKKYALETIKSVLESGMIVTLSPQDEDVSQVNNFCRAMVCLLAVLISFCVLVCKRCFLCSSSIERKGYCISVIVFIYIST